MIHSMTGFGRGKAENDDLLVQIDLRSVNHRFLDLRLRLPFFSPELEECLQAEVGKRLHRGKVDLTLQVVEKGDLGSRLRVNRALIRDYLGTLEEIGEELGLGGQVLLDHIANLPWGKVFDVQEMEITPELMDVFRDAVRASLDQLVQMREREGARAAEDLGQHLDRLEAWVSEIQEKASDLVPLYREKLADRIRTLMQDREPDEDKLLQEAAFLADKSDISEEVSRLRAHIQEIHDTLGEGGPVGKKLDFLMQECHREVNTIGSKSKGVDVGRQVVEAKASVEAMREQVQNVE